MSKSIYAKPSYLKVSAKEIKYGTPMCWRSAEGWKARSAMVGSFLSPTAMLNDICKKLDLGADMAKVCLALNIPTRIPKWRWLLNSDDLPTERDESSTKHPEKWKADARSSKDEARTSRARDVSPLRKKPRLPSVVIKFSLKEGSSAEKIGGMQNVRGILLKSLTDKLKTCNLPCKESRDEDRTGRTSPPPNLCNLVKHGADSKSLTPLEARMAAAKKDRDELEKKNVDMTSKLSVEQVRHEIRMLEIKESMSLLKSSLAKKDSELNSSVATLHSCKLLVEFEAYHKATEQSKSEVAVDVYKLGYMDCKSRVAPCHSIEDEDVETFCLNVPSAQSEQINVVDIEAAEEQVVDKTVAEEDDVEADTKEVAEHGSPVEISQ
ncbi:unnamed protein product [Prunus brigantina]